MPGVQDSSEGADLRLDLQPEVQGEAGKVGPRGGRPSAPDIIVKEARQSRKYSINAHVNSLTPSHSLTLSQSNTFTQSNTLTV